MMLDSLTKVKSERFVTDPFPHTPSDQDQWQDIFPRFPTFRSGSRNVYRPCEFHSEFSRRRPLANASILMILDRLPMARRGCSWISLAQL